MLSALWCLLAQRQQSASAFSSSSSRFKRLSNGLSVDVGCLWPSRQRSDCHKELVEEAEKRFRAWPCRRWTVSRAWITSANSWKSFILSSASRYETVALLPTQLDNNLFQTHIGRLISQVTGATLDLIHYASSPQLTFCHQKSKKEERRERKRLTKKSFLLRKQLQKWNSSTAYNLWMRSIFFPSPSALFLFFSCVWRDSQRQTASADTTLAISLPPNSDFIWRREWLKVFATSSMETNSKLICCYAEVGMRQARRGNSPTASWADCLTMNFKSPHLRWIIVWECVERLAIDGQRSLQLSLIRIKTAELQQRADSRVLVRRPIS